MKRKSKKPCHYSLCSQFITEYSSVPLLIKPLPDILLCSGLLKKPLVKMMLPTLNHCSFLQTSELTAVFSPVYPSWFVILNISCFAWNKIPWLFKRHMGYSIFIMRKTQNNYCFSLFFIVLRQESTLLTTSVQPYVSEILYTAWMDEERYHMRMWRLILPFISFSFSDWSLEKLFGTLASAVVVFCCPNKCVGLKRRSTWGALIAQTNCPAILGSHQERVRSSGESGKVDRNHPKSSSKDRSVTESAALEQGAAL